MRKVMEFGVLNALIVEDEAGDARLLELLVVEAFPAARCKIVASVAAARAAMTEAAFDVVLCDLNLPDCTGPDTVKEVRACAGEAAVVTVTGSGERQTALAALRAGALGFLVKGEVDAVELRSTVDRAIEGRSSQIARERARFVLTTSLDGFVVCGANGQVRDANDAFATLVGIPRADLLGRPMSDLWAPDQALSVADVLAQAREQGSLRAEGLLIAGDALREVDLAAHWRPDGGGEMLAFVRDMTERNRLVRDLAESEERFRDVSAAAGEYLWEVDEAGRYTYVSERVTQVVGYAPEELLGRSPFDFMPPEEAERVGIWFMQVAAEGAPFRDLEHPSLHKRGHVIWQWVSGLPVRDAAGKVIGYRGAAMDVTLRRMDREALEDREERLSSILGGVADAIISIDETGCIRSFNPAAERIFGWMQAEVLGHNVRLLMPEPYAAGHQGYLETYLHTGIPHIIGQGRQLEGLRRDGTIFPMDLTVTEARRISPRLFIGIVRDITDRKAMEDELRRLATTDPLTGAANRRRFFEVLHHDLAAARRLRQPLAVAMLDIDHFKRLNDTYGHAAGDAALQDFVADIQARLRETDTLGRLGGEEFALVLPGTTAEQAVILVNDLREHRAAAVLPFEGHDIRFTLSAGITDTLRTGGDLMAAADAALYGAKDSGRNRVTLADAEPEPDGQPEPAQ